MKVGDTYMATAKQHRGHIKQIVRVRAEAGMCSYRTIWPRHAGSQPQTVAIDKFTPHHVLHRSAK